MIKKSKLRCKKQKRIQTPTKKTGIQYQSFHRYEWLVFHLIILVSMIYSYFVGMLLITGLLLGGQAMYIFPKAYGILNRPKKVKKCQI